MELKLSDSFLEGSDGDIKVKVRMLDVNVGCKWLLLETCKLRGEYFWSIGKSEEIILQIWRRIRIRNYTVRNVLTA